MDKNAPVRLPVPPKQDRSRETLRRLVVAARELLDEKGFDDVSVAEIAKRGGSSVGAFYARFRDKDTLLDYLVELYAEDVEKWEMGRRWDAEAPLSRVVRETIEALVSAHRRHRGTLRAVVLRAMAAKRPLRSRRSERFIGLEGTLAADIKKRWGEFLHPNPETATWLAREMVYGVVRDRILFPELNPKSANAVPITDAVLVEELSRAVLAYLGVDDG